MPGPVAEFAGLPASGTAAPPAQRLRARLGTTPARIALAAVTLLTATIAFGGVAVAVERSRETAAYSVVRQTEPLLAQAVGLYASLSDADATAARTYLTFGIEPRALRSRYQADLQAAGRRLSVLARRIGASGSGRAAVATITEQLPVYSGLVESARADNRFGLPLGAAYLRQASSLMQETILPAARRLYETEAKRLNGRYRSGTGSTALFTYVLVLAVLLFPLVLTQIYLARATRRVFNTGLLAATVLIAAVWIWGTVALVREQNALVRGQRTGSDSVEVLTAIRILALRAQTDEGLALTARGGGDLSDFDAVRNVLTTDSGTSGDVLGEAALLAGRTGTVPSYELLRARLGSYFRAHDHTTALERSNFLAAITYALGPEAARAERVDRTLDDQLEGAQRRFAAAGADATSALDGLSFGLPAALVACAALCLVGLQRRLREYR